MSHHSHISYMRFTVHTILVLQRSCRRQGGQRDSNAGSHGLRPPPEVGAPQRLAFHAPFLHISKSNGRVTVVLLPHLRSLQLSAWQSGHRFSKMDCIP